MSTIPTKGQVTRDPWFHFWKIDLKLLVFLSLSQFAAAFRATRQFRYLRLVHFRQARLGALHKTALPSLASRPFRKVVGTLTMLDPMSPRKRRRLSLPDSFQFFHFGLQKSYLFLQTLVLLPQQFVLFLQHFILLSQARVVGQYLSQLLLQLRKLVLIQSRHNTHQFTNRIAFLPRVFQPVFSKIFALDSYER